MSSFVGTWTLLRLAIRRDGGRLAVWIVALTGIVFVFAVMIADLYPTVESRQGLARGVAANPTLAVLFGPAHDLTTVGGLIAWRMSIVPMILVPLMAVLTVVRHTRAEEEAGRIELVGSTVVGRRAPLAAGLAIAFGASLAIGLIITIGLIALGLPADGSLALALSYAAAGCVFAGVAGVTAQLTETSGGASGAAIGVLGGTFLLRGIGDAAADGMLSWLTWASPLGWVLEVRAFTGEHWWVLGLLAGLTVVLIAGADFLVSRRDIGAGFLPPRPGPPEASPRLRSPIALAWRLHRGPLLGWTAGLATVGILFGSIAAGMGDLVATSPELEEFFRMLGGDQAFIDGFLAATLGIGGLTVSAYAIQATLWLRTEETSARAEHILSTPTRRTSWALSHLVVAIAGSAIVLVALGLGEGIAHGLRVGDLGGEMPRVLLGALVQLPAAIVLAGLTFALFGMLPRYVTAAWGALVAFLLLGQLGPLLQLEEWMMNLSPFTHVPMVPGENLTAAPILGLLAAAAGLILIGLAGIRRRDLD